MPLKLHDKYDFWDPNNCSDLFLWTSGLDGLANTRNVNSLRQIWFLLEKLLDCDMKIPLMPSFQLASWPAVRVTGVDKSQTLAPGMSRLLVQASKFPTWPAGKWLSVLLTQRPRCLITWIKYRKTCFYWLSVIHVPKHLRQVLLRDR